MKNDSENSEKSIKKIVEKSFHFFVRKKNTSPVHLYSYIDIKSDHCEKQK